MSITGLFGFRPGETLVVKPNDGDDPLASQRAGKECRFVRFSPVGYAVVEFDEIGESGAKVGTRRCYFRPTDLAKREAVS